MNSAITRVPPVCPKVWAGNRRATNRFELPGLTAWVYSVPAGVGLEGGDVYYVSVCTNCIVSRIALADVSGHGKPVTVIGEKLGELMHLHLHSLEQVPLMRDLNQAVYEGLGGAHYASMVAIGWHVRRGLLVMTNAGHPPPLWYRASRGEWTWLETQRPSQRKPPIGLPLGLFADVAYDRLVIRPEVGDLIVLYSDGVSESRTPDDVELGQDGLLDMVRELRSDSLEEVGAQLVSKVRAFRGYRETQDDETIIVVRRTTSDVIGPTRKGAAQAEPVAMSWQSM